jgi:tetratricopeptide (TPR) repeat protein
VIREPAISVCLSAILISPPLASLRNPQPAQSLPAAQASQAPLTLDELIRLLKKNRKDLHQVAPTLAERGVDSDLDEKTVKKLRKAGADDALLEDIWKVTPTGKAQMKALLTTPSGVELQASPGEAMALRDIENEADPGRRLRMTHDFEEKFPNSLLLSFVYTQAAKAWQQRGDLDKVVENGEKSLKLDPDNTFALVIMAVTLVQPKMLQGNLDEGKKRLSEAESDANRALALLGKLTKGPNETDEEFHQRKGSIAADAHFALGSVQMQHEDFAKAASEYQMAISSTAKPTFQHLYRLGEAYANEGQIAQAIEVLRKASDLARGTPMQKYADDFTAELQRKSH